MLEIPEEALENLLAALARMNIGFVLGRTVQAALRVMRENRIEREREKLAVLEEPPTLWECEEGEEEADRASPGIPVAPPIEPLRELPTGPIPLGGPLLPPASTPKVGGHVPTTASTWEEMEAALRQFRDRDRQCQRARADPFAAFQKWMEGHPEPPKAIKGLVEAGGEQAGGAPPHRQLARRPDRGPPEESPRRGGRTETGGRRGGPMPRGNPGGIREGQSAASS